ncbi:MAG: 30S ribosomal protein S16 [Patescibacteria group bacterium]
MLSIRLQRVGRRHDPSFRIVATDSRSGPKTNKHCAILGNYDTIRKTTNINDIDKVKKYISCGAQLTDTVYNIFVDQGIIEGKKKNALPRKSPIIDEEALAREAEAKAAAEAVEKEAEHTEATEELSEADRAQEAQAETEADEVVEESAQEEEKEEEAQVASEEEAEAKEEDKKEE